MTHKLSSYAELPLTNLIEEVGLASDTHGEPVAPILLVPKALETNLRHHQPERGLIFQPVNSFESPLHELHVGIVKLGKS